MIHSQARQNVDSILVGMNFLQAVTAAIKTPSIVTDAIAALNAATVVNDALLANAAAAQITLDQADAAQAQLAKDQAAASESFDSQTKTLAAKVAKNTQDIADLAAARASFEEYRVSTQAQIDAVVVLNSQAQITLSNQLADVAAREQSVQNTIAGFATKAAILDTREATVTSREKDADAREDKLRAALA